VKPSLYTRAFEKSVNGKTKNHARKVENFAVHVYGLHFTTALFGETTYDTAQFVELRYASKDKDPGAKVL
jgi:hypothetical protein